jgi:hypothetical protein
MKKAEQTTLLKMSLSAGINEFEAATQLLRNRKDSGKKLDEQIVEDALRALKPSFRYEILCPKDNRKLWQSVVDRTIGVMSNIIKEELNERSGNDGR